MMLGVIIILIAILLIMIPFIIVIVNHAPFSPLPQDMIKEITQNGIIHYTSNENAEKIRNSGKIIPGRPLYCWEKNLVWLYSGYGFSKEVNKNEMVQNFLKEKKHEVAIIIDVTEDVMSHLTYRKGYYISIIPFICVKDRAIVYRGSIPLTSKTQFIKMEE